MDGIDHRAFEEPRQYLRASRGTVVFDTQRFAQLGRWAGHVAHPSLVKTSPSPPTAVAGARDRSWGVRPVGEKQPDGIRQNDLGHARHVELHARSTSSDHSIIYMCHEEPSGNRPLEEGVRVWHDGARGHDWLGRPEWSHDLISGTRLLSGSRISFPEAPEGPITVEAKPLVTNFISLGTGYGMDQDWRHGMWQGETEVVQALEYKVDEIAALAQYGVVDSVGRFSYNGNTGYGLYEHGFFGPFEKLNLHEAGDLFL